MKKINSTPYQRTIQPGQQQRSSMLTRVDRLTQSPSFPRFSPNQYYRKHNSPDATKLRSYNAQNPLKKPQQISQTKATFQYSPLTKTSSSPKLIHNKRQVLYTQTDEYQKLHDKLNSIQDKIMGMKRNIQRKREEKLKHQEMQKKEKENKREKERDQFKNRQQKSQKEMQLQQQQHQPQQSKSLQKDNTTKNKLNTNKNPLKGLITQVEQHKELHTFQRNPYSPRHSVYYVSEVVRAYLDEKSLARQHILTSLHILRILEKSQLQSDQQMKKRQVNLPYKKGKAGKKCIIFDLDQTLIHCNDSLTPPHDIKLPIKFPTGQLIQAGINIRPYAREILINLSKHFQIIVFTASHSCYANVVLDHLDPTSQLIDHRLYREHCYQTPQGMYTKDLRILPRPMQDMVLVDNAAYSYAFQLDNGIPILPYYHGGNDFQLKVLEKYIMGLAGAKDVREANKKTFKLHQYKYYYGEPEKMVEDLYINNVDGKK